MKNFVENISANKLLFFGVVIIFLFNLPYIILGENSWFNFGYDSLDSNVLWFKLISESGKMFSPNDTIIQPALSGLPRSSFPAEFSFELWLYYFFKPISAYILNIIIIQIIAFIGLFLLLFRINKNGNKYLIFFVALIYSLLPFYPHAGIGVAGLPLIYYGYLQVKKYPFQAYLILLIYILYSSFVITGMFLISILLFLFIYKWIKNKTFNKNKLVFIAVMLSLFLVTQYRLILSTFSSSFVSHRVDVVFSKVSVLESVSTFFTILVKEYGHNFIGKISIVLIILGFILFKFFLHRKEFKNNTQIFSILLLIVFLSFLSALFRDSSFRDLYVNIIPFLKTIQLQRFYWLLPPLFYVLLFLVLDNLASKKSGIIIVTLIILFQFSYVILRNSTYRQLIKTEIFGRKSEKITFREFYSIDLYKNIAEYINKPQSSYRVASIGLQPAAALYNGFYTIDGYFFNYSKEYKDRFFKIIEPELNKNKQLYEFFNDWGSVCIIPSYEIIKEQYPNGYIVPVVNKDDGIKSIQNLSINTGKLIELNCRYIFSSVIIENSEKLNLKLLKTFDQKEAPYIIHLYAVE